VIGGVVRAATSSNMTSIVISRVTSTMTATSVHGCGAGGPVGGHRGVSLVMTVTVLPQSASAVAGVLRRLADVRRGGGLPQPGPVRVLPLQHQVAQRIHACTEPGSSRAHDLVDLQLMEPHLADDLVAHTCERLFRFRKQHTWPPVLSVDEAWEEDYLVAAEGLEVLPDVHAAASWLNGYVARLSRQH
jgi:hypothetical protein